METRAFWQLANISDARLQSDLGELLVAGYRTEARIIAHLAELEQRKLHLKDGSESLYRYCTSVLRLSNSEAFHRITAARVARKFPIVFGLLEQRQLHLTAICLLRDYLTAENHQQLLAEACHKTKWQIEELLARRFPRPDVESRIRKLPVRTSAPDKSTICVTEPTNASTTSQLAAQPLLPVSELVPAPLKAGPTPEQAANPQQDAAPTQQDAAPTQQAAAPTQQAASERDASNTPGRARRAAPAPVPVEPLSEARYRIQLNASRALKEKLDRLRALTRHTNPSGDLALVIERALDLALEQVERQRFAKTDRPRPPRTRSFQTKLNRPKPKSEAGRGDSIQTSNGAVRKRDHVPNAVLREIAERDQLQCSYRSASGCRCTARAFLQVHHERPWARGGDETPENLRLLCASHNQLLAERDFGVQHVQLRQNERRHSTRMDRTSDR